MGSAVKARGDDQVMGWTLLPTGLCAHGPTALRRLDMSSGAASTHLQSCQGLGEGRGSWTLACVHQDDQPQVPHLLPEETKTDGVNHCRLNCFQGEFLHLSMRPPHPDPRVSRTEEP